MKRVVLIACLSTLQTLLLVGALAWLSTDRASSGSVSVCGDVNGDGQVDIGDPTFLLQHLFAGGPLPECSAGGGLTAAELSRLVDVLQHVSIEFVDDGSGGLAKTIRFSGVNLQVVNGSGITETTNGLGNLVVGYNEAGSVAGDVRTGSHNIVGGARNSYSNYGGLVVADSNTIDGPFAVVSGGTTNRASGENASVSGGAGNVASGDNAAISGGFSGVASNNFSSVSGGRFNSANAIFSSVVGGLSNSANGMFSSILGGEANESAGLASCVSGGQQNLADGDAASISGGVNQATMVEFAWAAGSGACALSCP